MSVKIADALEAKAILEQENIFVISEQRAAHQDIRPLKLLILNLMPTKTVTETQLLRKLSNTPLQVEVEFLHMASHNSRNTDAKYLENLYRTFGEVKKHRFDGLIITGAPVETLEFENVDYWPELCEIMLWSAENVYSTFHICWGAQAGLFYHYGIGKHPLTSKMFGIFEHNVLKPRSPFFRGFDDIFNAPHSRYTTVLEEDILNAPELELLSTSDIAGVYAVKSTDNRRFFVTGHPEYDAETLATEYFRDQKEGLNTALPVNYFPQNDSTKPPIATWRAHAQLMYNNWLNYYVYQSTPYDWTI
jgi:homoserine O-succinyltransferase